MPKDLFEKNRTAQPAATSFNKKTASTSCQTPSCFVQAKIWPVGRIKNSASLGVPHETCLAQAI
jgi:hypothetical protein